MRTASFQTRGRVIDLLGREQIADAPAAISELLKNALDAGATSAEVDYRKSSRCIVVSDFGLGMRQSDLLEKWLVVATESKRGEPDHEWLRHASAEQKESILSQPALGEKGIGRLAVAALGRAVLVWSRWGSGKDAQRSLLFVHWGLFQHPHIGLEEAPIPFLQVERGRPEPQVIKRMTASVEKAVRESPRWAGEGKIGVLRDGILDDLESGFGGAIDSLTDLPEKNGTTFVILGVTDEFEESMRKIEHRNGILDTPESLKTIVAFCDPFSERKRIDVRYFEEGKPLSPEHAFWQPDDLRAADHFIDLNVNADGFVSGKVRRYHERIDYTLQLPELPSRVSSPGPMRILLGYVPGKEQSRLTESAWNGLDLRLQRYGGLYVYRDGIRVMPYGKSDFDFAKFEERRTLNAGVYFFSHRRMFGGVYLTKNANGALIEKAGREGFIHNGAYRGFVKRLEQIFVDLAKAYFGTNPLTPHEHPKRKKRDSADRLRRRAKAATEAFQRNLASWRRRLPVVRNGIKRDAQEIERELGLVEKASRAERLPLLQTAMKALDSFRMKVAEELATLETEIPALVSLDAAELRDYDAYITERGNVGNDGIRRAARLGARCAQLLGALVPEQSKNWADEKLVSAKGRLENGIEGRKSAFRDSAARIVEASPQRWVKAQLASLDAIIESEAPKDVSDLAERARRAIEVVAKLESLYTESIVPFWNSVELQLELLDEAEGTEVLLGDIYRRTEQLEARTAIVSELAQLGQIVEGIDHEYKQLFYNADQLLRELAVYVKPEGGSRLKHLGDCLRALENKQNLLSPLYQRRGSTADFSGADIEAFIERLYSESRRQGAKIEFGAGFRKIMFRNANQATVFAAAANLVSNGLFWVGKNDAAERKILFQDYAEGFLVSDSGPGIHPRDRSRIFEPFFSRRPSGRGLGLYIAKTNLESCGFRLEMLEERPRGALNGACFHIWQVNNE